jgi:ACR3 family arsenite efflux pump ArsB
LITSFFYTYTGIIGFNTLWADILLTFVIPVIIGKYISYKLLIRENQPRNKIIPAFSLLILLFAFVLFTFRPPHLPLFEDKNENTYGIFQVK